MDNVLESLSRHSSDGRRPGRVHGKSPAMHGVEQFIRNLNQAWTEQRYDDLIAFFHDNVVMLIPGSNQVVTGADNIVQSYRDFASAATVHEFRIEKIQVHDYGSLAMCHMEFMIDYELESGRFTEPGLEIYTLESTRSALKVVWRTQLSK